MPGGPEKHGQKRAGMAPPTKIEEGKPGKKPENNKAMDVDDQMKDERENEEEAD